MSYPYDMPSLSMSTIWNSGSYKPADVVKTIIDNSTPVNKSSMSNSVGQEIALVQNYVNSKLLGRAELPVVTGFITNITSNSGQFFVYTSGINSFGTDVDLVDSVSITPKHISLFHFPQNILQASGELTPTGFYSFSSNGVSETQTREMYLFPEQIYVAGTGPSSVQTDQVMTWNMNLLPNSGISFVHTTSTSEINGVDVKPTGIIFRYSGTNEDKVGIYSNHSGKILCIPSGKLVINSGEAYGGENSYYGLTVGCNPGNNDGDVFFKTHGGNGVAIYGDNGSIDRIVSMANANGQLYITCGSTSLKLHGSGVMGLPEDASSTQTAYDLINAIKACLIERGLATAI